MGTIALGTWLFVMSGGIANIALPRLAAELDVAEADIVWVTVAFQIAAVSLTIPLAAAAEIVGFRRMYVGGLIVFSLGSVACGLATDFLSLTLARVVQGLGAAGMSSVNAALLRRIVPDRMLGRGIASLTIVFGAAQGAAPVVGSAILEIAHWRWLFFYDLPLSLAAVLLALAAIPRDAEATHRFDAVSAALCVPALGLTFFALDRLARDPAAAANLGLLAGGLAALLVLVLRQRGRERPLFPTDLLTMPRFAVPAATSVVLYGAQGLALAALPFVLVRALGLSLVEAGVMMSILPLASLLTAPVVGVLIDRLPRWPFNALGAMMIGIGFAVAWGASLDGSTAAMTVAIGLIGVGFALFQNHNGKSMMLSAPIRRMGAAGGVQSTCRVAGMMIGPALVGISFHAFGDEGTTVALLIGLGLAAVGATLGFAHAWLARKGGGGEGIG